MGAALAPSKATSLGSFQPGGCRGLLAPPSPHLSDKQDTLQEHVVLVILIHGLLIDKVPGLQTRVIWEQQRVPSSEPGAHATGAPHPTQDREAAITGLVRVYILV